MATPRPAACGGGGQSSPLTRSRARAAANNNSVMHGITKDAAPTYRTSHYPSQIHEVFSNICETKTEFLREVGLDGLIHVPDLKIDRNFSLWCLTRVKVDPLQLQMGNGQWIPITENDVERIMGVRARGIEISSTDASDVSYYITCRVKNILATTVVCLSTVREVLGWDFSGQFGVVEKEAYQVAAVLFSFAYLLESKTRNPEVPKGLMKTVTTPGKLKDYNWASYVLRAIKYAALKVKGDLARGTSTVVLGGCLLFLQLFYLEKLDFGRSNILHVRVPVLANYYTEKIKELIHLDTYSGISPLSNWYGRKKVLRKDLLQSNEKGKGKMKEDESLPDGTGGVDTTAITLEVVKLIESCFGQAEQSLVDLVIDNIHKCKQDVASSVVACLLSMGTAGAAKGGERAATTTGTVPAGGSAAAGRPPTSGHPVVLEGSSGGQGFNMERVSKRQRIDISLGGPSSNHANGSEGCDGMGSGGQESAGGGCDQSTPVPPRVWCGSDADVAVPGAVLVPNETANLDKGVCCGEAPTARVEGAATDGVGEEGAVVASMAAISGSAATIETEGLDKGAGCDDAPTSRVEGAATDGAGEGVVIASMAAISGSDTTIETKGMDRVGGSQIGLTVCDHVTATGHGRIKMKAQRTVVKRCASRKRPPMDLGDKSFEMVVQSVVVAEPLNQPMECGPSTVFVYEPWLVEYLKKWKDGHGACCSRSGDGPIV